jgi:Mrp family chromosome partitioning ATPase
MSKNFELMQQVSADFQVPSIPQPSRVFSKVREKTRDQETRLDVGQVGREEVRRLVQRIFLSTDQKPPCAVVFAGIDQAAGSRQVCLLVAEILRSAVGGSICVVEANLRSARPGPLGTGSHLGLTDALVQEGPIRSFARLSEIHNVWLLSPGSLAADSPNILSGDRLKARFDELRTEFDYLLVDAPSLTHYADATALGQLMDGLVLVLEANSTRKESALMVMENLRAAKIQVLGAVLNKRTFPIPESIYKRL